jgi:hypothetical protein
VRCYTTGSDDVTQQHLDTVPTQHAALTSHGKRRRGISRDLRVSASEQSVCKEQSYESVVK